MNDYNCITFYYFVIPKYMKSTHNQTIEDTLQSKEKCDTPISLKLPQSLHLKIVKKSIEINRSKSDAIRLAIEEFVNQNHDTS